MKRKRYHKEKVEALEKDEFPEVFIRSAERSTSEDEEENFPIEEKGKDLSKGNDEDLSKESDEDISVKDSKQLEIIENKEIVEIERNIPKNREFEWIPELKHERQLEIINKAEQESKYYIKTGWKYKECGLKREFGSHFQI